METYRYLTELEVSYLHVFSYSERPNTPAADMSQKVADEEIARRSKMLQILSEKKRRAFYEQQLGSTELVLFEAKEFEGVVTGFTRNYVKVEMPFHSSLINTVRKVELLEINHRGNVQAKFVD